jgi:hypothetical protein
MQTKNSSKSGIFLMELILSILFFSIAAAVCVKLFVTAHRLSDQSVNLNHAVAMAESIAEAFYGCNGNVGELETLFPDAGMDEQTMLTINNTDQGLGAFVKINASGELISCEIRIGTPQQITAYQEQRTEFDSVYELQLTLFPQEELMDETE